MRPIDLAQEVGFVQFALGPAVEHRLDTPREHLETEDHVGSVAEQRRDRMKLPAMVLRLIVRLAEQHDAALRAFPEKTESRDSPAGTNRIQGSCWNGGQHGWRNRIRKICMRASLERDRMALLFRRLRSNLE